MYVIKWTFTKDGSTPGSFYEDQKFNIYQEKMYRKKLTHEHQIYDGKTLRHIQVWPSEEEYRKWADDPTVMKHTGARDAYNAQNHINMKEVTARV